jgi:hypothetical protein
LWLSDPLSGLHHHPGGFPFRHVCAIAILGCYEGKAG